MAHRAGCCRSRIYNSRTERAVNCCGTVGATMAASAPLDDRQLEELVYGRVVSVDSAGGRCNVAAGDVVTQPIRWVENRAGATRSWSPPSVGEQVLLLCPGGDPAGAVALRGIASAAHPPVGDAKRELVEFGDGTVLAYNAATHELELLVGAGRITLVARGGIRLAGPVELDGDLEVRGTITARDDVVGAGKSLKDHLHTRVQAGAAVSGPPQ